MSDPRRSARVARGGMRRAQRGAVSITVLGLALCLLLVGGVTLDAGRALEARRSLAAMADAAALAGADGIDEAAARRGVVRLDPARVRRLVARTLRAQGAQGAQGAQDAQDAQGNPAVEVVAVVVESAAVRVVLRRRVVLTLARLAGARRPVTVTASARAAPRLVP